MNSGIHTETLSEREYVFVCVCVCGGCGSLMYVCMYVCVYVGIPAYVLYK